MTPTLLLSGDTVRMIVGTPGGSTIFTSVFQTMVNRLDFNMSALEAVSAARFHHQLLPPNLIVYSPCCTLGDAATLESLKARGWEVRKNAWEFGDMQLIDVDAAGHASAAADPRGRGVARVFDVKPAAQASRSLR